MASPLTIFVYSVIKEQIGEDAAAVVARIVSSFNSEQTLNMMTLLSSLSSEQVRSIKTLISNLTQEQKQIMKILLSSFTPEQTEFVITTFAKDKENQSSSGELENPINATPQSQGASSAPGTSNSATEDNMGLDVAQTMAAFVSDFLENRPISTVQSETPSKEATELPFNFSSIGVPAFCTLDNSANQDEIQSTSTVLPETTSREAPQSQFDFSSVRNLVYTFFDTDNKVEQDEPQELTENKQRSSDSQFDFSSVRNLVHTLFNTDNSAKRERTENSQQKHDDYLDDVDLD